MTIIQFFFGQIRNSCRRAPSLRQSELHSLASRPAKSRCKCRPSQMQTSRPAWLREKPVGYWVSDAHTGLWRLRAVARAGARRPAEFREESETFFLPLRPGLTATRWPGGIDLRARRAYLACKYGEPLLRAGVAGRQNDKCEHRTATGQAGWMFVLPSPGVWGYGDELGN